MFRHVTYLVAATVLLVAGGGAAVALATNPSGGPPDKDQYENEPKKVFVCKYVGTPGADERLQTGQNPISVSVNAIPAGATVGAFFADAQGRSFVLAFDVGQPEPSVDACPGTENPPPPVLPTGVTFTEATCTSGPSFQLVKTTTPLGQRPFYSVEGPLVDGKPVAGASYTITAIPVEGYTFEGQTVWTHTFAAAPTNCSTPPPPPPSNPCPPGQTPGGKDGQPGNDDACVPITTPPSPPAAVTPPPAATPPPAPVVTPTTPVTTPPAAPAPPVKTTPPTKKKATSKPPAKKAPKGAPKPAPKTKPCPPGTRKYRGKCHAIVEGSG